MTIEKIARAARDTTIDLQRAAMPMTATWTLNKTIPDAARKAVERTFFPLQFVLALGAELAVINRKHIVGV
jgi:hypothetical protein